MAESAPHEAPLAIDMAQRRGAAALSAQLRRAFHASGRVQAEVAPSPNGTKAVNEALRPQPSRLEVRRRTCEGRGSLLEETWW